MTAIELASVYDVLTAPLERRAFAAWRRQAWDLLPAAGLGLEIGVGTGANSPYHPAGATVVAVDVSQRMLSRARRKTEAGGPLLAAADAEWLPFRDRSFGFAAATLVFCEVSDPVRGLAEVRRVLRPGAPLVLLEHVRPSGALGRLAGLATRVSAPLWGEHFDRDTAVLAAEAGFEVEEARPLWKDTVILIRARR